jgi:glutaminyl-peptide cyclotransferase
MRRGFFIVLGLVGAIGPLPFAQALGAERLRSRPARATASLAVALADAEAQRAKAARTPVYGYTVVNSFPHDPTAFTQGLIFRDGVLFESTGHYGKSSVRKVTLETGEVLQRYDVDARYFAEGLTDWGNRLIQLTYTTNVGFVYDLKSLALQRTFTYTGEGWGLTHDARRLIMSDGTSALRFLDPETLRETGRVVVKDGDRPIDNLNELELVKGDVYANVWTTDRIAIISPDSGRVTAWLDLAGIRGPIRSSTEDVLNGIAYDAARDRLFVTGKYWSKLFEIRVRRS